MRTLNKLTALLIIAFSISALAADKQPDRKKNRNTRVVRLTVEGSTPECMHLNTNTGYNKKTLLASERTGALRIQPAPFIWGDANDPAPEILLNAIPANVPVAPFIWGNAEEVPPVVDEIKN